MVNDRVICPDTEMCTNCYKVTHSLKVVLQQLESHPDFYLKSLHFTVKVVP